MFRKINANPKKIVRAPKIAMRRFSRQENNGCSPSNFLEVKIKTRQMCAIATLSSRGSEALCMVVDMLGCLGVARRVFAEAPWSAAEWAVALLFVKLLQAQPGRQAR